MRFYRLKVNINAAHVCDTFNEQFQPEVVDDRKRRINWIMNVPDEGVLVGEKVRAYHVLFVWQSLTGRNVGIVAS